MVGAEVVLGEAAAAGGALVVVLEGVVAAGATGAAVVVVVEDEVVAAWGSVWAPANVVGTASATAAQAAANHVRTITRLKPRPSPSGLHTVLAAPWANAPRSSVVPDQPPF